MDKEKTRRCAAREWGMGHAPPSMERIMPECERMFSPKCRLIIRSIFSRISSSKSAARRDGVTTASLPSSRTITSCVEKRCPQALHDRRRRHSTFFNVLGRLSRTPHAFSPQAGHGFDPFLTGDFVLGGAMSPPPLCEKRGEDDDSGYADREAKQKPREAHAAPARYRRSLKSRSSREWARHPAAIASYSAARASISASVSRSVGTKNRTPSRST